MNNPDSTLSPDYHTQEKVPKSKTAHRWFNLGAFIAVQPTFPKKASLLSVGYFKFFFSPFFAHGAPQLSMPVRLPCWSFYLPLIQMWRERPKQDRGDGSGAIHQRDRGSGNPSNSKSLRRPPNSDSPPVTVVRIHELSARSPPLWGDRSGEKKNKCLWFVYLRCIPTVVQAANRETERC